MPLFSKVFKSKDAGRRAAAPATNGGASAKPQWVDSWLRTRVDPDEVAELLHGCTHELKSRALDVPFLLLPFRPSSDPSAARTFVRNYFLPPEGRSKLKGAALMAELKMTEVMVLISVMKWCWARLPGGVVSWETYKMFSIGEKDAKYARDAFTTFIPISVESPARVQIINDFFDLLASLAAHGKSNGLGGYKLSRYAGWWAFEHYDSGKGFEAGYKAWDSAANATCHLFFAYLRSSSPEAGKNNGILDLPRSLQHLVAATEYPPRSSLLTNDTTKVVMVVDVVSPTPYALLRRARNFEYRDDDRALQRFTDIEDPVSALTDECQRVLRAISTTNQSNVSDAKTSTSLVDPSWSRFEDIGFSSALDEIGEDDSSVFGQSSFPNSGLAGFGSNARQPHLDFNRPTTPSWADFLSTGFQDEGNKSQAPILLPPDKILPPLMPQARGQSSQSHRRDLDAGSTLEPGELASITKVAIDDAFWWVWISSLAGEEPTSRKAVFGRCAYVETVIVDGQWMIMEEQVKGAAPEPVQGAYIAEKKGFLGFTTKNGRLTRRRSGLKKSPLSPESANKDTDPASRATIGPDQQARIHKAALELSRKQRSEDANKDQVRGRRNENDPTKFNSVYTLGDRTKDEASSALQWTKQYDKNATRATYLGNELAGKGSSDYLNGVGATNSSSPLLETTKDKDLPTVPHDDSYHKTPSSSDQPRKLVSAMALEPAVNAPAPQISELSAKNALGVPPPATPLSENVEALPNSQQKSSQFATSGSLSSTSPEASRRASPPSAQKSNGIKRLFGTMRKNKDETDPTAPAENPAVAAARRALEGKVNASTNEPRTSTQIKSTQSVRSRIAALSQSVPEPKTSEPVRPVEKEEMAPIQAPAPVVVSAPVPEPEAEPTPEPVLNLSSIATSEPGPELSEPAPPRTRRDEEFDQLSRVDTREREQADREFSRFDQGPLTDQPAFMQEDSPIKEEFDDSSVRQKHQSVYSQITMNTDATDEESQPDYKPVNAYDRWAQIRKNAADRAARTSEDQGTRSRTETRTDDGDTSEEETIESRVARINARIAKLTGNMETTRR